MRRIKKVTLSLKAQSDLLQKQIVSPLHHAEFNQLSVFPAFACYSTVTDFARFLGLSTSQPLCTAM